MFELVEIYQNRARISERQFDIKLSVRKFFKSKERKDWSKKYNYDWKNHARFNEEFSKWLKIMTYRLKKPNDVLLFIHK